MQGGRQLLPCLLTNTSVPQHYGFQTKCSIATIALIQVGVGGDAASGSLGVHVKLITQVCTGIQDSKRKPGTPSVSFMTGSTSLEKVSGEVRMEFQE